MKGIIPLLLVLTIIFSIPVALGHTPLKLEEDNHNLEAALEIKNPTKSWTLYREIHEIEEADYYKLDLGPGERLVISLYVPRNEDPIFAPTLIVMGPDIQSKGEVPTLIEAPKDVGIAVIEARRPQKPEYEPFTPSSYFYLADVDVTISNGGTYHFAVYEPSIEGRYGLAVGYREVFTLSEWLLIPLNVISIHGWERQSLAFILAPLILTLLIGLGFLFFKIHSRKSLSTYLGFIGGLLFVGSGFMTLMQMLVALTGVESTSSAVITTIFIVLPILMGFQIMRIAHKTINGLTLKERATLAILGVAGLFIWAGILLGPILVFLASVVPGEPQIS